MRPVIMWFRRDLRVDDNAALFAAARLGVPVIPLYIFDRELIATLPSNGAVFDLQAESLRDLRAAIASLGGRLILREGNVLEVHQQLITEFHPTGLYYNRDYEPFARERDNSVERLYRSQNIGTASFTDVVVHDPDEVLKADGRPYAVFTPFAKKWRSLSHPEPFGMPQRFTTPHVLSAAVLDAEALGRPRLISQPAFIGGLRAAEQAWNSFLDERIQSYDTGRDVPARHGTSRISAYLRFGCISPRRILSDSRDAVDSLRGTARQAVNKYIDELIWREFYQAVLYHHPHLLTSNYRSAFDGMPWSASQRTFNAWKEGKTGFPLVDAGMRELNETGWMHNRVRMITASFLTKDLHHHWKRGEEYFARKLLDIETASNNGGWQWSASTGVDPKPLRIFNPTLQAKRYDPDGTYIRRFVPELRNLPQKFIHKPQSMPSVLQREIGCVIGRDYPAPIVDHAEASAQFKEAYYRVKREAEPG